MFIDDYTNLELSGYNRHMSKKVKKLEKRIKELETKVECLSNAVIKWFEIDVRRSISELQSKSLGFDWTDLNNACCFRYDDRTKYIDHNEEEGAGV